MLSDPFQVLSLLSQHVDTCMHDSSYAGAMTPDDSQESFIRKALAPNCSSVIPDSGVAQNNSERKNSLFKILFLKECYKVLYLRVD